MFYGPNEVRSYEKCVDVRDTKSSKKPNKVANANVPRKLSKTIAFNKNCSVTSSFNDKRLKYFEA